MVIQQEIKARGRYGGPIWEILGAVADKQGIAGREHKRRARLELWHRLKRLLHTGVVFRFGRRNISAVKVPRERTARRQRRLRPGSAPSAAGPNTKLISANLLKTNWFMENWQPTVRIRPQTQSKSAPSSEATSAAARSLAQLPRGQLRRWTGWLSDHWRGYRDQCVIMPNGEIWFLYGARRGTAVVTPDQGRLLGGWGDGPFRWRVIRASELRRYRSPEAQLLGRAKFGRKERPSLLKQQAAQRNGLKPCREGKRRGRVPQKLR